MEDSRSWAGPVETVSPDPFSSWFLLSLVLFCPWGRKGDEESPLLGMDCYNLREVLGLSVRISSFFFLLCFIQ